MEERVIGSPPPREVPEEEAPAPVLSRCLPSCPHCGSSDNPEGEIYCRVCGASLERK